MSLKKIIVLLILVNILFTLCGCKRKKDSGKEALETVDTTTEPNGEEIDDAIVEVNEDSVELESEDEAIVEIEESQGAGGF